MSGTRRMLGLVVVVFTIGVAAHLRCVWHNEEQKAASAKFQQQEKKKQEEGKALLLAVRSKVVDLGVSTHAERMAWERFKFAEFVLISQGHPNGYGDQLFQEALIDAQDWAAQVPPGQPIKFVDPLVRRGPIEYHDQPTQAIGYVERP